MCLKGYKQTIEQKRKIGERAKERWRDKRFRKKMFLLQTGKLRVNGIIFNTFNKYTALYMPEHPNANKKKYVSAHRYLAEAYLNRFLDSNETVHHIDKNPENNTPENIFVFNSNSEHIHFHRSLFDKIQLKSNII